MKNWKTIIKTINESSSANHRVLVTYSDPQHTMVSKRKEKQQKHVRVPATDKRGNSVYKAEAEELAKKHMKRQGYRVHEVSHVGLVNEAANPAQQAAIAIAKKKKKSMAEGYWQVALKKAEADREARKGKPFKNNPASHDKNGVYKGDKDLAGNPVPKRKEQGVAEGTSNGHYYLQGGITRSKNFASESEAMAHSKQFFQLARVSRVTLKYKAPGKPPVIVKEFSFGTPSPKPSKPQMSWGDFHLQSKKKGMAEGTDGAYEKAEEHLSKANDAEREGRMKDFHTHMADHHEAMSEWHESKGRSASADKHAEKADMHHEKSLTVKEDAELDEVSKELANRYMHSAFSDRRRTDDKMMDLQNKQKGVDKFFSNHKKITKLLARSNKRTTGISRALDRLQKEGTVFQSSARLRLADALRKEREKIEAERERAKEAERVKQDVTKPQDKA